MTIVLLIRHGLTDANVKGICAGRMPGVHLNSEGQAQAAALARRVQRLPIAAVYSSPIERAVETAQAVADARALTVQTRPGLIETDTGSWTGQMFNDIQQKDAAVWHALQTHPKSTRIPGGETIDEIAARMAAATEEIRLAHPSEMVAVVSHADPIKAVIAHYIGLDLDRFQRLHIGNTSVSVLALNEHGATLHVMNHLGDIPDLLAKKEQKPAVQRITSLQEGQPMPRVIYDIKPVLRITATAEGLPGQRTFYVQARDNERLFTLICEKQQVAALALGIQELLEGLDEKQPEATPAAPVAPGDLELEQPLEPVFRVGQMGLGYDQDSACVVIVAYELPESEDADPETLAAARFWATPAQARALAAHAATVVAAGRPICPLCGESMDASGHVCPKKNGHKKIEIQ
jgi:probable phosphoglycerate mutase